MKAKLDLLDSFLWVSNSLLCELNTEIPICTEPALSLTSVTKRMKHTLWCSQQLPGSQPASLVKLPKQRQTSHHFIPN